MRPVRVLLKFGGWRVPLPEPADGVAEGVECEHVRPAGRRAIEHRLHVLERERPADAVEQLVQHPPTPGLGGERSGEIQIAAIARQLAREDVVQRHSDLVVARIDARHISMPLDDVSRRWHLQAELQAAPLTPPGDRPHEALVEELGQRLAIVVAHTPRPRTDVRPERGQGFDQVIAASLAKERRHAPRPVLWMRLVQEEAGQPRETLGSESREVALVSGLEEQRAGVRVAQVDVAAEELVVGEFSRGDQPDLPGFHATWSAPGERRAGRVTHVAACRQVHLGRLEQQLLVLEPTNMSLEADRFRPPRDATDDGYAASTQRNRTRQLDLYFGSGRDADARRLHLPGAVLGVAQNHFAATGSARVRELVRQPHGQTMLLGGILDQPDELEPALRQVRRLETRASGHLDATNTAGRHGVDLAAQFLVGQPSIEEPHGHRPIRDRWISEGRLIQHLWRRLSGLAYLTPSTMRMSRSAPFPNASSAAR